MNQSVLFFITFLHNLFTVIWVGGLILMLLVTLPAAKKAFKKGPELFTFTQIVQKRQQVFVWVSIFGLIVTGLILSKQDSANFRLFAFTSPYAILLSIKHILTIAMVLLAGYRSVFIRKLTISNQKQQKFSIFLLATNTVFGLIVLFLSAMLANMG